MITDPIADYLTRIRNAIMANHKKVLMPYSKIKKAMTEVLEEKGYIRGYQKIDGENLKGKQSILEIELKYSPGFSNKQAAIVKLVRVSKPGLRKYSKADKIPHVINGLGISILSTSKGIMSDKEARAQNIGGEVLCYVY